MHCTARPWAPSTMLQRTSVTASLRRWPPAVCSASPGTAARSLGASRCTRPGLSGGPSDSDEEQRATEHGRGAIFMWTAMRSFHLVKPLLRPATGPYIDADFAHEFGIMNICLSPDWDGGMAEGTHLWHGRLRVDHFFWDGEERIISLAFEDSPSRFKTDTWCTLPKVDPKDPAMYYDDSEIGVADVSYDEVTRGVATAEYDANHDKLVITLHGADAVHVLERGDCGASFRADGVEEWHKRVWVGTDVQGRISSIVIDDPDNAVLGWVLPVSV